jgi:hypothetical protein
MPMSEDAIEAYEVLRESDPPKWLQANGFNANGNTTFVCHRVFRYFGCTGVLPAVGSSFSHSFTISEKTNLAVSR